MNSVTLMVMTVTHLLPMNPMEKEKKKLAQIPRDYAIKGRVSALVQRS